MNRLALVFMVLLAWIAPSSAIEFVLTANDFDDTYAPIDRTDYFETSFAAAVSIDTTATSADLDIYRNLSGLDYAAMIAVYVDGAFHAEVAMGAETGVIAKTVSLPVGSKRVTFANGLTSVPSATVTGTWLTSITVADASASIANITPFNRVLIYGDSIAVGDGAQSGGTISEDAWVFQLREGHYSTNSVACEGWGFRGLEDDANGAGEVTAFVAKLATYSPSKIVLSIGTNDYGLDKWNAASFSTGYNAVLDEINSVLPGVPVVCYSPIPRSTETANSFGDTLQDYRDAILTACSTRSWATYLDGTASVVVGDLVDGVHPNATGHGKMFTQVSSVILALNNAKGRTKTAARRAVLTQ